MFAIALTNDSIRLSAAITVQAEEITKSVDTIRHAHESQFQAFESSRLEVVDHIHGLSEGVNSIQLRQKDEKKREMLYWLKTPEILWCQGIPVSGKTILASLVIDKLRGMVKEDLKLGVAGIYCSCKEPETTSNLIRSLIR